MITLTPTLFPVLEWTSFRPGTEPENLKLAAVDSVGYNYMRDSPLFRATIALLGFDYYQGNNLETRMKKEPVTRSFFPHKHLYLSDKVFQKVDSDMLFRNFALNKSGQSLCDDFF